LPIPTRIYVYIDGSVCVTAYSTLYVEKCGGWTRKINYDYQLNDDIKPYGTIWMQSAVIIVYKVEV